MAESSEPKDNLNNALEDSKEDLADPPTLAANEAD
jgi:hypothetical protein